MPTNIQFEKIEKEDSKTSIKVFLDSRIEFISKLIRDNTSVSDLLCLEDTRFKSLAGFPLYVKRDGTLTTDVTNAMIVNKKAKKELVAAAESFQEIRSLSYDELQMVIQECEAIKTNY